MNEQLLYKLHHKRTIDLAFNNTKGHGLFYGKEK